MKVIRPRYTPVTPWRNPARIVGLSIDASGTIKEARVQITPNMPAYRVVTEVDNVVAALMK